MSRGFCLLVMMVSFQVDKQKRFFSHALRRAGCKAEIPNQGLLRLSPLLEQVAHCGVRQCRVCRHPANPLTDNGPGAVGGALAVVVIFPMHKSGGARPGCVHRKAQQCKKGTRPGISNLLPIMDQPSLKSKECHRPPSNGHSRTRSRPFTCTPCCLLESCTVARLRFNSLRHGKIARPVRSR